MAEFQDVMKQAERMCKAHEECEECPVCKIADMVPSGCLFGSGVDAGYIEEKIMGWAKEHPEKRYPSWFDAWGQLFGNTHAECPCPKYMLPTTQYEDLCDQFDNCDECKRSAMSAVVAEKLGIKPVGVKSDGH